MKTILSIFAFLVFAPFCLAQTVIFADDFEAKDFSAWSYTTANQPSSIFNGAGVVSTAQAHSGLYSFAATLPIAGNRVNTGTTIGSQSEVYFQCYFYIDPAWTMTNAVQIMSITGGGQVQLRISGGTIYLKTYSGINGTHAISTGAWHSLQYHELAGSGTGVESVTLDGVLDINSTGATITGPFTYAYMGLNNANGQTGTIYFDDAQIASSGPLTAPAANITVRYPNTNARTAFPVDVTMWGVNSTDILTASVDSVTVYTNTGSMTQHERFIVPITSLSTGSHTFQVQLQDSGNTPKATFTGSFTTYLTGTPTVYIDGNNNIYLGGQRYFFVSPFIDGSTQWSNPWLLNSSVNTYGWQSCFVAAYAYTSATFNSCINAVGYPSIGPDENWTGVNSATGAPGKAANQVGAVATATGYVTADKGNANLFMWSWGDEPNVGPSVGDISPTTVFSLSQATWLNDGNHPVITNLGGYVTTTTTSRQNNWFYPIVPNSTNMVADVYESDTYPLIYQYSGTTVTQMIAIFDRQLNYTYNLVPFAEFIEVGPCSSGGACTGYGPTAVEANMEAWLAVIHGVKGISWWGPEGWTVQDSAHWTAMANFVSQTGTLASTILSPTELSVASSQTALGSRVDATARKVGLGVTVFAARLTDVDAQAITNVAATSSVATYTVPNYYTVGQTVAVYGLTNSALNCTSYTACVVASLIGGSAPYTGFTIAGTYTLLSSTADSGMAVGNDSNEEAQSLSTTLTVNGSSFTGNATVLNESRTVPVVSGVITDTFNSYATHIYQYSESTPVPTAPGNLI